VSQSAAGLLLEKELNYLGKALEAPEKPFVAILGGAESLRQDRGHSQPVEQGRCIAHRGGMAYTFLKAKDRMWQVAVGSRQAGCSAGSAQGSRKESVRFLLPIDHVLADKFAADAATQIFEGMVPSLPGGWRWI